jgi:hypothetical protein
VNSLNRAVTDASQAAARIANFFQFLVFVVALGITALSVLAVLLPEQRALLIYSLLSVIGGTIVLIVTFAFLYDLFSPTPATYASVFASDIFFALQGYFSSLDPPSSADRVAEAEAWRTLIDVFRSSGTPHRSLNHFQGRVADALEERLARAYQPPRPVIGVIPNPDES